MRCDNVDQTDNGDAMGYRNNDSGSCNHHFKFCSGFVNEQSTCAGCANDYQAGCANFVIDARMYACCSLGLLLLTWINSNPSIDT